LLCHAEARRAARKRVANQGESRKEINPKPLEGNMKRLLILLSLMVILLLPTQSWAQLDLYGHGGAGMVLQDGNTKVAVVVGGDVTLASLVSQESGLAGYTRIDYMWSKFDEGTQAVSAFAIVQKRLGVWRDLYFGLGAGLYNKINDDKDGQKTAIRFLCGTSILGNVGLDLSADYVPSITVIENGNAYETTRWIFHGSINLFPRL
jgi:hypothetical protein